ncbi:hypothetical protein AAG906_013443 [Vitis piasezkii]
MGYIQGAGENQKEKEVEKALHKKMEKTAEEKCRRYLSKFTQCVDEKRFFRTLRCRKQSKEHEKCLHQYNNDTVFEKMKKEYMGQGQGK